MESEAKLGLLAGVAAVLAVAVVYFQKPAAAGPTRADPAAVAGTPASPPGVPPAAVLVPTGRP